MKQLKIPPRTGFELATLSSLYLCQVFAVVQKAGTTVMQDGEELDSWSVIVNGQVEISGPALPTTTELGLGDRLVASKG